jgi:hypothetical protein
MVEFLFKSGTIRCAIANPNLKSNQGRKDGSPVLVVITQAYNLAASRFLAFIFSKKCIMRYFLPQTSGRAEKILLFYKRGKIFSGDRSLKPIS